jgi:phosphoglucomutase
MDQKALRDQAKEYLSLEAHPHFRDDLEKVLDRGDMDELNDRFYTSLSFGTGGLRGMIGGGYNRMNPFMVQQATQGLANYIRQHGRGDSAVIAYDSRRYSDLFAEETAKVLCANGIRVWLFSALRPTPELSFAVRELGAAAGIVITASHNPPEYNGYKVYWADGGQIVPPHDKGIIEEVRAVGSNIQVMDRADAEEQGLLRIIDEKIDAPYRELVKSCSLRPELLSNYGKELKVVYTPLHGTGAVMLPRVLGEMGVEVIPVPEQAEPDGNFPTVEYPNPEEASAMEMGLAKGRETGADLVMGTDPDSDRLAIAVPGKKDFRLLNGNQLGVLLADYIFSTRSEQGSMPDKPAFVKTIVTTELQRLIAENYGARCYDTLTGFKYIAEKIGEFEKTGETYLFGGEESYGYLVTDRVRDKDAISAAFLTAEMTLYHRRSGKSLLQRLEEIWEQYGYFEEILISRKFAGQAGQQAMERLIEGLRSEPPASIGESRVHRMKDYREGVTVDVESGSRRSDIDLPRSNVLQFLLEDGSIVTARPSGTEPKVKFYASCRSAAGENGAAEKQRIRDRLAAIESTIDGWVSGTE